MPAQPAGPSSTPRPATATPLVTATLMPTAVPSETPTTVPTPTATDTSTPVPPTATPTPDLTIAVGTKVLVGDTGGANLRLRSGPGTDFLTFKIVQEGIELEVIGGPERADEFVWWRLRDPVGVVGWAAEDWLIPIQ